MKTIYKYPIKVIDEQELQLPKGYKLLTVINQNDVPVIYAIVDTEEIKTETLWIRIFGTGNALDDDYLNNSYDYLGTVITCGGSLIWHVFTY